ADGPEALAISLNELGRLDWTRMQELTGKTPTQLQEELGPLVYQNPTGRKWEPADEYLSGDVRAKLKAAELAAKGDASFDRNVQALKEVQPKDLTSGEISARLGSPWIPAEDVADFIRQLLDVGRRDVTVRFVPSIGTWTVALSDNAKRTVA